jgi:hypothetical protein
MLKRATLDKYKCSGAYKLTCPDCNKVYVRQTGRSFNKSYKEHKNAFKANSHTSICAKHVLEQSHIFGPMHQTMQILQYWDKGTHFNDEHSISPNKIFDGLLKPHQP